jgi:osmoprotectant transport system substrate-binding protein
MKRGVLALLAAVGAGAAPAPALALEPGPMALTIADKVFTESRIVAQLYGLALEDRGFAVEYRSYPQATGADEAVLSGEIQLYPEYTGTALTVILGETGTPSSTVNFRRLKRAYASRGLTALEPSRYRNDNRVACTRRAVREHDLDSLSDLRRAGPELVYTANPAHYTRRDGYPLLRSAYGIRFRALLKESLGESYRDIRRGRAQCLYAFGTDPQVAANNLVFLRDDRGRFQGVPYESFPVVSTAWLRQADPAVTATITRVTRLLDQRTIVRLNAQVDLQKRDARAVARALLRSKGVIDG